MGDCDEFSHTLYFIMVDKCEGEAYEKLRAIPELMGIKAYCCVYRWFTEISGLGLSEQARRLMHPDPPKKEEDLAEFVDQWTERVRRLEAHGDKYALPALYKVTALRYLMVGKSKELFEIWESEYQSDDDGGFTEILNKVRDYARRKKLDGSVSKAVAANQDMMDCGHLEEEEEWWYQDDQDEVNYMAKGKGKGKGKGGKGFQGRCFSCGQVGHPARECPQFKGGKGKGAKGRGKGTFFGECYSCGQKGALGQVLPQKRQRKRRVGSGSGKL